MFHLEGISGRRLIFLAPSSVRLRERASERARRRGGFLSFGNHENFRLLRLVLDLLRSAWQRWQRRGVPLPLTIGFSALLPSSYRFFLFRENFLTVAFDRRDILLSFLSVSSFSSVPSARLLLPWFSLSEVVSRRLGLEARRFLSTEREGRFVTGHPSSPSPSFQALREISFSLNHRRPEETASSEGAGYSFAVCASGSGIGPIV